MIEDAIILAHDPPALTDGERRERRAFLEARIKRGLETAAMVYADMIEIRENELYRPDYATWTEYCQVSLGINIRSAQYRLAFAVMVENLGARTPIKIESERQARELTKLTDPDQQAAALEAAAAKGPVTTSSLRAEVARLSAQEQLALVEQGQHEEDLAEEQANREEYRNFARIAISHFTTGLKALRKIGPEAEARIAETEKLIRAVCDDYNQDVPRIAKLAG